MTEHNRDWTRVIAEMPMGIACYEGAAHGDQFKGTHKGVCRDWEDARKWLDGGAPESFIQVYPMERL